MWGCAWVSFANGHGFLRPEYQTVDEGSRYVRRRAKTSRKYKLILFRKCCEYTTKDIAIIRYRNNYVYHFINTVQYTQWMGSYYMILLPINRALNRLTSKRTVSHRGRAVIQSSSESEDGNLSRETDQNFQIQSSSERLNL